MLQHNPYFYPTLTIETLKQQITRVQFPVCCKEERGFNTLNECAVFPCLFTVRVFVFTTFQDQVMKQKQYLPVRTRNKSGSPPGIRWADVVRHHLSFSQRQNDKGHTKIFKKQGEKQMNIQNKRATCCFFFET